MPDQARILVREVRRVKYAAETAIARIYRGHIARRFAAWVRKYEESAKAIERLVRGFLARCLYRRMRTEIIDAQLFVPKATIIQKHIRGYLGRKLVKAFVFERLHEAVAVPCARCIQRTYRGALGRSVYKDKLAQVRAVARIQALVRGFLLRCNLRRIRLRILKFQMAVQIQKIARSYIERKVVKRRMEKRHRLLVVIPSAILLQANIRGWLTRLKMITMRRQWYATLKIQAQYRTFQARKGKKSDG
jgi:hypothetical protein